VTAISGGIGDQYAALAPALARRSHRVHVITLGCGRAVDIDDVQLHLHPDALVRPVRKTWQSAACRTLRGLGRFDVVMACEWGADAWTYARDKSCGPLISNLQTSSAQLLRLAPGLPRWTPALPHVIADRLSERDQVRRSDALLACSQAVLAWAGQLWPIDRVPRAVLHNAIDVDSVRSLARTLPSPVGAGSGLIVFAGRLEERKGPHVLVAAMRAVWRDHPEATLALVGREQPLRKRPMSDHLRALAGRDAGKLVFLGDQPPERLFPLIAAADVVAVPSFWEAFGIVALEAMALGRPVVASAGSGFSEFIRDGRDGLLVAPGDVDALAQGLLGLLGDSSLAVRLGESAAERADTFRVERAAERFEQLCGELLRAA